MNKRSNLSILFLVFYAVALVLSLSSCSGGKMRGLAVEGRPSYMSYNDETGLTSVHIDVFATNENSSHAIRGYKFRVVFKDVNGITLSSRICSGDGGISPSDTVKISCDFIESLGTAIEGEVYTVAVFPDEMQLLNEEIEDSSSTPKWGFWAWFWTIVCAILVLIFFIGCIGAEWDSSAVIGGIIVCVVPAIIILVIYFGFIFGSGV